MVLLFFFILQGFFPIFNSSIVKPQNVDQSLMETDVEMQIDEIEEIKLDNKKSIKKNEQIQIMDAKIQQVDNKFMPTINMEPKFESKTPELDSIRLKIAQTELSTILMQLQQEEEKLAQDRYMYIKQIALLDMEIEIKKQSLQF